MSYLGEATGPEVQALYEQDRAKLGYVPNYTKLFAHRPRVYRAWQELNAAVKAGMDPVRYEVSTLAAAGVLQSSYCMLAHGAVLAQHLDVETVVEVAQGTDQDPLRRAISTLAAKVAHRPAEIDQSDLQPLRSLGLSDAEILDVVVAAAARCFFSSVLEALGAEPDAVYARLAEPLPQVLSVGRPIQSADG